jgi:hypothetical protein
MQGHSCYTTCPRIIVGTIKNIWDHLGALIFKTKQKVACPNQQLLLPMKAQNALRWEHRFKNEDQKERTF